MNPGAVISADHQVLRLRSLADGRRTRVLICDTGSGHSRVLYETAERLLEAPNWTPDGAALILNGEGAMWRVDVITGRLTRIPFSGLPDVNNDHVLSPDGRKLFMSANDSHIYEGSVAGGAVRRVTRQREPHRLHFLHGVSPDGGSLAYVGLEYEDSGKRISSIFTRRLSDGTEQLVIRSDQHVDGCEFTADGKRIYFNTDQFNDTPGHAQIARIPVQGGEIEQLTDDERVNWFPHPSPDGASLVYLSYEPGTLGHPADRRVELRLADAAMASTPVTIVSCIGGQGTINVNSWAPDGRRFAYVDYPMGESGDLEGRLP